MEQPLQPGGTISLRDAIQVGVEVEVLDDREIGVEPESLRHVRDPVLHPFGIPRDAQAVEEGIPLRRSHDAGQHSKRRRLPRPVGTDQPEQLAPPHLEGEVVDGCQIAEAPGETLHANRRFGQKFHPHGHRAAGSSVTSAGIPGFNACSGSSVSPTFTA